VRLLEWWTWVGVIALSMLWRTVGVIAFRSMVEWVLGPLLVWGFGEMAMLVAINFFIPAELAVKMMSSFAGLVGNGRHDALQAITVLNIFIEVV
jgi:hypothetical protein